MLKWKRHTPDGVQDILNSDCMQKKEVEENIFRTFLSYAYLPIETPVLEYYDVFAGQAGSVEQETMFKFFDHQGRILVLRPDLTTPIARVMGTKPDTYPAPARLCYVGDAFRNNPPSANGRLKELTQAGIELIGQDSVEADAEIISVAISSLLSAGLEEFQIELGQVDFFKGLMNEAGLSEETIEEIRQLVDAKDALAVEELLKNVDIKESVRELILSLPTLFGGIEVIEKAKTFTTNETSLAALERLQAVYDLLVDYGVEKYVSFDLGMVSRLNYYTGIIFRGFTYDVGFPICTGGRYDTLIQTFGSPLCAVGAAIEVNGLLAALKRQGLLGENTFVDSVMTYGSKGRKTAFLLADELRMNGLVIQMGLEAVTGDACLALVKESTVDGLIHVEDEEHITLYNLISGEKTETTLSQLLADSQEAVEE